MATTDKNPHHFRVEVTVRIQAETRYNEPINEVGVIEHTSTIKCESFGELGNVFRYLENMGRNVSEQPVTHNRRWTDGPQNTPKTKPADVEDKYPIEYPAVTYRKSCTDLPPAD